MLQDLLHAIGVVGLNFCVAGCGGGGGSSITVGNVRRSSCALIQLIKHSNNSIGKHFYKPIVTCSTVYSW